MIYFVTLVEEEQAHHIVFKFNLLRKKLLIIQNQGFLNHAIPVGLGRTKPDQRPTGTFRPNKSVPYVLKIKKEFGEPVRTSPELA